MNFDLVAAVIDAIRRSAVGTALGGRIYVASQVPPNAPFPRCYLSLRASPAYSRWAQSQAAIDRHQYVEIIFAQTTVVSATAFMDVQGWDKATRALVENQIAVPNLIWFQRIGETQPEPQTNDLTTYVMAGGLYDAYFEE